MFPFIKKEDYKGIWGDKKITKIPFLRGVFNFIDSLVLGMSTLTWSAQFFEEDEPEKNIPWCAVYQCRTVSSFFVMVVYLC